MLSDAIKLKKFKGMKTVFSIGHAPWNHYIHSRGREEGTIPSPIVAAIRRDRDGKTYTGTWHGPCMEAFIEDQKVAVKEMFQRREFAKIAFEEPYTEGFEIEGEFYDREETSAKLNMEEQYAEASNITQQKQQ